MRQPASIMGARRCPSAAARGLPVAIGLALAASLAAPPLPAAMAAPPEALVGELDSTIRNSIALARSAQQRERTIADLERDTIGADAEIAAKQRALAESEARQREILAALERLARNPPGIALLGSEPPLDRMRSGALIAAAIPALAGEARHLTGEIEQLTRQRTRLATRASALAQDRQELAAARTRLATLAEQRAGLRRQLLGEDPEAAARALRIGSEAVDLPDLLKRADAEMDRRDRDLRPRPPAAGKPTGDSAAAGDPTRPGARRSFDPHTMLLPPVVGAVTRRFGDSDGFDMPSRGLAFAAQAGASLVAPFDGRVEYTGPFRAYGLILIIGHGDGYHSMLAGLGRIDAQVGEWVVAGEPVGAAPEPAPAEPGAAVYYELRRDGRPIDPQMSLAAR